MFEIAMSKMYWLRIGKGYMNWIVSKESIGLFAFRWILTSHTIRKKMLLEILLGNILCCYKNKIYIKTVTTKERQDNWHDHRDIFD